MRRLLLVDDERALLDGLKKVLRPWRAEWEVETAFGGRAALEALQSGRTFHAVVSDARMPDVDGEAVLRAALEQQPLAVRLVLSGQTDAKTGHRLASVSHQFLTKPSSAGAIMAAVEECCQLCESLQHQSARSLVASLGQLPVSPEVYHRVTEVIDRPNSSSDEVARLIADDLVLTSSVLRFVNSAFFGLPRAVANVREAIVLLGFERLRELVLLAELFPAADSLGLLDDVRQRGLFRAQLARLITEGSPVTHLASEAALLTEIGVYALAWRRPDDYREVWTGAMTGRAQLNQLELARFGTTHAEVAAVLLGLWRIPSTVINAVRWHEVVPAPDAALDARTATALAVMIEEEAVCGLDRAWSSRWAGSPARRGVAAADGQGVRRALGRRTPLPAPAFDRCLKKRCQRLFSSASRVA